MADGCSVYPFAPFGLSDKPAGHVADEVTKIRVFGLLLNTVHDPTREIAPVYSPLSDGYQAAADFVQRIYPMSCFNAIKTAESVLVLCQNCSEVSGFRILDHLLELKPFLGSIAGDNFVGVPPNDSINFAFWRAWRSPLGADFLLPRHCGEHLGNPGTLSVIKSLHNHW
jgi:hypothetical protein